MKIKTSLIYSLAAGTLLGATVANAQTATDPVGFHTLTVYGKGASDSRYSLLAAGLVNPIEYASATTSITDTTITVDGTPFAELDYGTNPGSATEPAYIAYYVEVTSGAEAGAWANITANDDSSLTVDRDLSAAGAENIAIRKHVTIGDLFGYANEAGLGAADNASDADLVSLFANGASDVIFYDPTVGFEGWIDPTFAERQNTPIEPQQAVYVQRKQAGDVSFTRAGHVKVGPTKLAVNSGYNALANPRAVGSDDNSNPVFTLGNSNLHNETANSVAGNPDQGVADAVIVFQEDGAFGAYFYDTTGGFEGWTNASFDDATDLVLDNGKGFLLNRRAPGAPFVWTVPAETIAP